MSDLKFEGDIDGINEQQLEFVRQVLDDRGFTNEKVQVLAVGKAGDNYVANVKRFVVEKNGVTFKLVAKIAPTNDNVRENMKTTIMYQNETVMYTQVLPKFTELEKEANVPENERLRYAKCYGSQTEEPNEIILLEDLQLSDFVMLDRLISLTDESVKLVLKNFAILHSLSYKLKDQEPDTYETFKDKLVNTWALMRDMEHLKAYFQQLEDDVTSALDTDEYKNLVKGSLINLPNNSGENYDVNKDSKYSVIAQGDPWTNNILFKMKLDTIGECCMIDYQLSSINSPVADLHYMIFNCTDYETRSKHYHEWIDYYHDQLDKCLTRFGLDVKLVYPREKFDADLTRLAKMYLGICAMVTTMVMRESHEATSFKDIMQNDFSMDELLNASKLNTLNKNSMVRFKTRLVGLITSFKELGYL